MSLKVLIGAAALSLLAPEYYSVAAAVAGVMQTKANITARVQPMSGPSVYGPLISRGDVEFGLMNAIDVVNAYTGVENFKGRKSSELRLVGGLFTLSVGIAVPNDSPAKSIHDLKGLRMPSQFTAQSTSRAIQNAILATGGLSEQDMKPFPVADYIKGMGALGQGKVDAALMCVGCGAAQEAGVALASHGGIRMLPVSDSPESVAAMRKIFPSAFLRVFQPSAAIPGLSVPTRLLVHPAFLVSSTHVSDALVYTATKAIYENKQGLMAASASMKTFDPRIMAQANAVPYHPGAEKFYMEVGEWPPTAP
jgi:TRAP transporter TAXI family solute receptor